MLATLKFLPSLFAFAMTVLYHGNAMVANAINDSWRDLWGRITLGGCCFEKPGAAIDAIGWGAGNTAQLTASLFTKFSLGIYIPLAWLAMIVIGFVFITGFLNNDDKRKDAFDFFQKKKRLIAIMLFQFVAILPLFIPAGYDVGRLFFSWAASSLAVFLIVQKSRIAYFEHIEKIAELFLQSRWSRLRLKPWYLLFFGIPGCCWSVYVFFRATPIGFSIVMLAKLLIRIFPIKNI